MHDRRACGICFSPTCITLTILCNLGAQASYPAFGVEAALEAGAMKALSEVHLRRLDSPDLLHRRAVTVISIDARPEEVRVRLACWLVVLFGFEARTCCAVADADAPCVQLTWDSACRVPLGCFISPEQKEADDMCCSLHSLRLCKPCFAVLNRRFGTC